MERNAQADRAFILQDKVKNLMRDDPSISYDQAWRTANALPEMAPIIAAMKKPADDWKDEKSDKNFHLVRAMADRLQSQVSTGNAARAPRTPAERGAIIQSAVSKLTSEGKTYDEAWNIVKEHPDTKPIFEAMNDTLPQFANMRTTA